MPRVWYKWNNSKNIQFLQNPNTLLEEDYLTNFERYIKDTDVNGATDMVVSILQEAIKNTIKVCQEHI